MKVTRYLDFSCNTLVLENLTTAVCLVDLWPITSFTQLREVFVRCGIPRITEVTKVLFLSKGNPTSSLLRCFVA